MLSATRLPATAFSAGLPCICTLRMRPRMPEGMSSTGSSRLAVPLHSVPVTTVPAPAIDPLPPALDYPRIAEESFAAQYEVALAELHAELYDSGLAADLLAQWAEIVDASGLVDGATVASEAASVAAFFA